AWQRRQDLIKRRTLSENEQRLLDEFIEELL
ncbi:MAG: tRNA (guanosine(37)-N1)-methyltransferase TrmD, partial [Coxiella endosymbiont of Haemaphysalis japonica]